jgi:DNA-directed RNA polymerase specialized sigma24 family protein
VIQDGYGDHIDDDEFVRRWIHHAEVSANHLAAGQGNWDDIVQEALIHVWDVAARKPGTSAVYLAKASRMKALKIASGEPMTGGDSTPGPKYRPTLVEQEAAEEPQSRDLALEAVEWGYHHGLLHEALGALNPRDREYVVRRFWLTETNTEIARLWGSSNKALENRWHRTIKPRLTEALRELRAAS